MNSYKRLKEEHQKEVNNFPFIFAFNNEQLFEGMAKLGLKPEETDKICSIGAGGYLRKSDADAMRAMFKRHRDEINEQIEADTTGDGFIKDMFFTELVNHEFSFTEDATDALQALGLTIDEIYNKPNLLNGFELAARAAAND